MSGVVYLLGAGVNKVIKDYDGQSPPLINDFFKIALKKKKFTDALYESRVQEVFEYIYKYWKKNKTNLESEAFDLEECFTLLELQLNEALEDGRKEDELYFSRVQFRLKSFFAELLSEFERFANTSCIMREFGKVLYDQEPMVITFNYDTIIEHTIEGASGVNTSMPKEMRKRVFQQGNEIPESIIGYSHSNWNRPLGYRIKFDKVQLKQPGNPIYIEGNRFYSHPKNKLYTWSIIKLHGSLNWFRYLPIPFPPISQKSKLSFPQEKYNEAIIIEGNWWFTDPPWHDGWLIDPIIITPIINKEKYFKWIVYERIFSKLWNKAKEAISICKKLIVIGYSFPPTDFLTKKMFLEAFLENDLEELIVVNPDTSVVQKAKDLCHFNKPAIVCKDLEEYLRYYDKNK